MFPFAETGENGWKYCNRTVRNRNGNAVTGQYEKRNVEALWCCGIPDTVLW